MEISKKISTHNFYSFLWHAAFLAFAKNFMDIDTIVPAMLVDAGGGPVHIGIMSAIMIGGARFAQIFFAPFISNQAFKKKYLLLGINVRIFSLAGLGLLLFLLQGEHTGYVLYLVFLFLTVFSVAGAFANIGYTDILGKAVNPGKRKTFFSSNQIISGILVFASAFLVKELLVWKAFPVNYSYMYFIGATILLIASGGFWSIRESVPSELKISSFKNFATVLKKEMKRNKKLGYFLGFINTQGIAVSFLPFVILYAKDNFQTQSSDTGNFLLFKIIGMVFVSFFVLLGAKKLKYNILLYSNVVLSLFLGIMPFFIRDISMMKYIFVIGGVVYSLYTMSMGGLLLEISGNENRAIYTGFSGAGNILPVLFPLVGGTLIKLFGFEAFFILFMGIIIMTAFFIYKIDCKK